jgi:hypothetical protein
LNFSDNFENPGNPNINLFFIVWISQILYLEFGFPGFLFGFRRFCLDYTGFEFLGLTIQTKTVFCFKKKRLLDIFQKKASNIKFDAVSKKYMKKNLSHFFS